MQDEYDERPEPIASEDSLSISETTLKWSAREMFGAIASQAAEQIVKSIHRELTSEVTKSVKAQINEQVGAAVAQMLDTSIQQTNEWGEPKGQPMSLRDMAVNQARSYLGAKVNKDGAEGSYNADQTRLQFLVQRVVASEFDHRMKTEVKNAVEMARTQAVAKVGEVVGDLILKLK